MIYIRREQQFLIPIAITFWTCFCCAGVLCQGGKAARCLTISYHCCQLWLGCSCLNILSNYFSTQILQGHQQLLQNLIFCSYVISSTATESFQYQFELHQLLGKKLQDLTQQELKFPSGSITENKPASSKKCLVFFCCLCSLLIILEVTGESNGVNKVIIKAKYQQKQLAKTASENSQESHEHFYNWTPGRESKRVQNFKIALRGLLEEIFMGKKKKREREKIKRAFKLQR